MIKVLLTLMVFCNFQLSIAQSLGSEVKASAKTVSSSNDTSYSVYYSSMVRNFEGTLVDSSYYMQPEDLKVTTQSFGFSRKLGSGYSLKISSMYIKNDITLVSPDIKQGPVVIVPGRRIEASTEGLSDALIGINKTVKLTPSSSVTYTAQVSVPTGNYEEKTSSGRLVSYSGQLGSGTYDFVPEVTYRGRFDKWSFMGKALGKIRSGRNNLNYRLGDEIRMMGSVGYWFSRYAALTVGGYYKNWREVVGSENVDAFNSKVSASSRPARTHSVSSHGQRYGGRSDARGGSQRSHAARAAGQRPSGGGNPFADYNLGDTFAASGARWSAQVGVRSGIYLGPILRGLVEVGIPVAHEEIGELEGLDTQWYVMTALQSSF